MNKDTLLVARVVVAEVEGEGLQWVATTAAPYESLDNVDVSKEELGILYGMYRRTYASVNQRLNLRNQDQFFEYRRWILVADSAGRVIAFAMFKPTECGLKLGVVAHDSSDDAKGVVKTILRKTLKVDGVFAEVSDGVERVVEKEVPVLSRSDAKKVMRALGKEILRADEVSSCHYQREITNVGMKTKLLVGKPKVPPPLDR